MASTRERKFGRTSATLEGKQPADETAEEDRAGFFEQLKRTLENMRYDTDRLRRQVRIAENALSQEKPSTPGEISHDNVHLLSGEDIAGRPEWLEAVRALRYLPELPSLQDVAEEDLAEWRRTLVEYHVAEMARRNEDGRYKCGYESEVSVDWIVERAMKKDREDHKLNLQRRNELLKRIEARLKAVGIPSERSTGRLNVYQTGPAAIEVIIDTIATSDMELEERSGINNDREAFQDLTVELLLVSAQSVERIQEIEQKRKTANERAASIVAELDGRSRKEAFDEIESLARQLQLFQAERAGYSWYGKLSSAEQADMEERFGDSTEEEMQYLVAAVQNAERSLRIAAAGEDATQVMQREYNSRGMSAAREFIDWKIKRVARERQIRADKTMAYDPNTEYMIYTTDELEQLRMHLEEVKQAFIREREQVLESMIRVLSKLLIENKGEFYADATSQWDEWAQGSGDTEFRDRYPNWTDKDFRRASALAEKVLEQAASTGSLTEEDIRAAVEASYP